MQARARVLRGGAPRRAPASPSSASSPSGGPGPDPEDDGEEGEVIWVNSSGAEAAAAPAEVPVSRPLPKRLAVPTPP